MLSELPALFEYTLDKYIIARIVTGEQWRQNTYIVTQRTSFQTIIIDPGDNADFIISYIEKNQGRVTRILLTHTHFDHVGALEEVSTYFNVVCELHKDDVSLLRHAPMYALRFSNRQMSPISRFQVFEELCIEDGELPVRSIHTPGHTKGSVCLLFDGFLFTGDTLLYRHVGRTDLPGSSKGQILGSIQKLLSELSDECRLFAGHGRPWTIGEAREWWRDSHQSPPEHNTFGALK
jgi:hydroxyacylglutathione hydrolase